MKNLIYVATKGEKKGHEENNSHPQLEGIGTLLQ
jgi:hypothetical protein